MGAWNTGLVSVRWYAVYNKITRVSVLGILKMVKDDRDSTGDLVCNRRIYCIHVHGFFAFATMIAWYYMGRQAAALVLLVKEVRRPLD